MLHKLRLKLPLQFFAEAPIQEDAPQEIAKTFTQEDVNKIASRESKTAVEKLLKDAGIAPEGDYKNALKAFKDWQDSQKSDLDKASGALTAEKTAKEQAEAKATLLERKLAVISKGIPAEKADKYIKLAEAYTDDSTDFDKAVALALKDFPVTGSAQRQAYAPPNPGAGAIENTTNAAMNALIRGKI